MSPRQRKKARGGAGREESAGWGTFAAAFFLLLGVFNTIDGIAALAGDRRLDEGELFVGDLTMWGAILLASGGPDLRLDPDPPPLADGHGRRPHARGDVAWSSTSSSSGPTRSGRWSRWWSPEIVIYAAARLRRRVSGREPGDRPWASVATARAWRGSPTSPPVKRPATSRAFARFPGPMFCARSRRVSPGWSKPRSPLYPQRARVSRARCFLWVRVRRTAAQIV